METLAAMPQIVIGASVANVWVTHPHRTSTLRPDGEESLAEQFRRYGPSDRSPLLLGSGPR